MSREHTKEFHGLPVVWFDPNQRHNVVAKESAWDVHADFLGSPTLAEVFASFFEKTDSTQVTALVISFIGFEDRGGPTAIEVLMDVADRFPGLRALSIGHGRTSAGWRRSATSRPYSNGSRSSNDWTSVDGTTWSSVPSGTRR
ncbi:hypothetical protein AB0L06_16690 [Spirillospora sp. NPDC052269]